MGRLMRNAFLGSFVPDDTKAELIGRLDAYLAANGVKSA